MKLTTAHLSYEHEFVSIIVPDGDDIPCGRISREREAVYTCRWPIGHEKRKT